MSDNDRTPYLLLIPALALARHGDVASGLMLVVLLAVLAFCWSDE